MITVYFQYKDTTSEKVATFEDEEIYLACLPSLKELAQKQGFTHVTESVS